MFKSKIIHVMPTFLHPPNRHGSVEIHGDGGASCRTQVKEHPLSSDREPDNAIKDYLFSNPMQKNYFTIY